jgi:signal peptidase I
MARRPLRAACHYAIGLAVAALFTHTFFLLGIIVPVTVSGSSMWPKLREGDRLVVDRTAFLIRAPRRGEVVVFRCPTQADALCIKRVFALPGETVGLTNGQLTLNPAQSAGSSGSVNSGPIVTGGDKLPDGFDWVRRELGAPQTWTLSQREYFVVGDNRAASEDSRNWLAPAGLDARLVVGKALGVR